MSALGLLPILVLILIIFWISRRSSCVISSVLVGSLVWSLFSVTQIQILSLAGAISFLPVLGSWLFALSIVLFSITRTPSAARVLKPLTGADRSVAAILLAIGAITLVTALFCPPNTWDSLTYHVARVEHWIQNRSLVFYPTSIPRQILLPEAAEILILHLRILSGGDRLDNLVQWLSAVGSVLAIRKIAISLGASRTAAAFAQIFGATLPMGILQSTSTQNDWVVTFFLLCSFERFLVWRKSKLNSDAALMAAAVGLACATKGTAYVVAVPLGAWFLLENLALDRRKLALLAFCGLLAFLPNLSGFWKNMTYLGRPIADFGTTNAVFGLMPFFLNAVRNAAVNFATFSERINAWLTELTTCVTLMFGLDINDPNLSWAGLKFELTTRQNDEGIAGNPLHLVIAAGAIMSGLFVRGPTTARIRYALCVSAGAAIFLIVLRWQPWITRLQLPLFVLCAPLAAFVFSAQARGLVQIAIGVLLIAWSLPPLFLNSNRPFIGNPGFTESFWGRTREELLFVVRPYLRQQYAAVFDIIDKRGDNKIGLIIDGDDPEYIFWYLGHQISKKKGLKGLRIEHIPRPQVPSTTLRAPLGPFAASVIIVSNSASYVTNPKSSPAAFCAGNRILDGDRFAFGRTVQQSTLAELLRDGARAGSVTVACTRFRRYRVT